MLVSCTRAEQASEAAESSVPTSTTHAEVDTMMSTLGLSGSQWGEHWLAACMLWPLSEQTETNKHKLKGSMKKACLLALHGRAKDGGAQRDLEVLLGLLLGLSLGQGIPLLLQELGKSIFLYDTRGTAQRTCFGKLSEGPTASTLGYAIRI